MDIIRYPLYWLAKFVLSLRYWIRVEGRDEVAKLGPKQKVVILPNHPAYIDPAIVMSQVWGRFKPRPMVWQGIYKYPLIGWLIRLLNPVLIPDMDKASKEARKQASGAVEAMIAGLQEGHNKIVWPAGRLQRSNTEALGSTRAVSEIVEAVPDATIVLVRTHGLWGSSFTFAWTGKLPNLQSGIVNGVKWLFLNLFFFMPRRKITLTFKVIPASELAAMGSREEMNRTLERFYNVHGPEAPKKVPYHWFDGRDRKWPAVREGFEINLWRIKKETKAAIAEMMQERIGRPLTDEEAANADLRLEDLGLDSMERMDLSLDIESRFGFSSSQSPATLGECWGLAQGEIESSSVPPPPATWFKKPAVKDPSAKPEVLGQTIPEAFVNRALASKGDTVLADDLSGVLAYWRLLTGATILGRRFAKIDAPNLGLMLPASVAGDVAFLGMHLVGKLPVLLNWTTGPANLAHAAKTMGLTHVVTSRKFIDKAAVEIEGVEYMFLEDLRKEVGKWEQISTALGIKWFGGGSVRRSIPKKDPDEPAVVLFTSGSEKAPKAVPLTHRNLIRNVQQAIEALPVTRADAIMAFLPAFHSFGLTTTILLPILGGMRSVHHPDPTDAGKLAKKCAAYNPTMLVATPTFLNFILDRAKPNSLLSLRLAVVGAEKCPDALFTRFEEYAPDAALVEGYGATECAPVVSVNRPGQTVRGSIGLALPGVDVRLLDAETREPMPVGTTERGILVVAGENVFPGYLHYDGEQPFAEFDGKRWYVTGDLVTIDPETTFITFAGRLKRFIKSGGEMISLPALEQPFTSRYPNGDDGPRAAVEGIEQEDGKKKIVLFVTPDVPLNRQDANKILQDEGLRGVMRLDDVRTVESIPTLGTGKTDYKIIRRWVTHPDEAPVAAAAAE